jgi:hypothetical protein
MSISREQVEKRKAASRSASTNNEPEHSSSRLDHRQQQEVEIFRKLRFRRERRMEQQQKSDINRIHTTKTLAIVKSIDGKIAMHRFGLDGPTPTVSTGTSKVSDKKRLGVLKFPNSHPTKPDTYVKVQSKSKRYDP